LRNQSEIAAGKYLTSIMGFVILNNGGLHMTIRDKVAVVTGASKGIGRQTALALAAAGNDQPSGYPPFQSVMM
jgi:hypothetical protein